MSGRVKLPKFQRFVPRLAGPSELEQALRSAFSRLQVGLVDMTRGEAVLAEVEKMERDGVIAAGGDGILKACPGPAADLLIHGRLASASLVRNRDPSLRS